MNQRNNTKNNYIQLKIQINLLIYHYIFSIHKI
jgi:hypothetical protein